MSDPQFSVLIPSFNHRRFLAESLRSALRAPEVAEVVVADDGSSDGSKQWLDHLAERSVPRLRVLDTRGNAGAHARLNELVGAASNDWVAVLNSDDWFLSGRFRAAGIARRAPATLVFGYLLVVDGAGRPLGPKRAVFDPEYPFPGEWRVKAMFSTGDHRTLLSHQNYIASTSNMIFSKRLHAAVGGFRGFRYVHDWDFALRSSLEGQVVGVPHFLSAYRRHERNTIGESKRAVVAEVRRLFDTIAGDYPAFGSDQGIRRALDANPYLCGGEEFWG